MGQRVGLAGHRQGIAPVALGHDPLAVAVPDPGDLILHQGPEQPAIERRLLLAFPGRQLDDLVDVEVLAPAPAGAIAAAVGGGDIEPGTREQVAQLASLPLVHRGPDPCAGRHPVEQGDLPPLEHQPEFLPIHPSRLVEAVIEVDQGRVAVADRATHVLLDGRPRPDPDLRRLDPPLPEPAGKQVEEMDPVFHEDAAAPGPVPEPVVGRQVLVRGVVLERAAEHLAQSPALDKPAHGVVQRVVPLHQVGDKEPVPLPGDSD